MMPAPTPGRLRLGVLVSGRGSNLQAILDGIADGRLAAEVRLVLSNRPGVAALTRAAAAGVPARCLAQRDFADRPAHHAALAEALLAAGVELVVTAGFDRILDPGFLRRFPDRVINIHPSLLPAFGGTLHAPAAALEHGVKLTGCTVHFVTEAVDAGPIIAQAAVPVHDDDDQASLTARILAAEHRLLPEVLGWFAAGRVRRAGRHVRLTVLTP